MMARLLSLILSLAFCLAICKVARCDVLESKAKYVSTDQDFKIYYGVPYTDEVSELRHQADIYLPTGKGPFPTLLMVHGGAWFSGNKAHVSLHARHAATSGFAVVAINYRLAPAHPFPAQLDDCKLALSWIQTNADRVGFDTDRIAGYGYSAGAHLVGLLAATQNDADEDQPQSEDQLKLKAVVCGGTPCEFSWIPLRSERLAFWLGGSREKLPDAYEQASPLAFVDKGDPPVFMFHGDADRIVPISSPQKMKQQLDRAGVDAELLVLPKADHFRGFINEKARESAIGFLAKKLKIKELDAIPLSVKTTTPK